MESPVSTVNVCAISLCICGWSSQLPRSHPLSSPWQPWKVWRGCQGGPGGVEADCHRSDQAVRRLLLRHQDYFADPSQDRLLLPVSLPRMTMRLFFRLTWRALVVVALVPGAQQAFVEPRGGCWICSPAEQRFSRRSSSPSSFAWVG